MITIHDRDEIPVGFSNDTNDRYCIIASFESPDEVEKFISDHNIMNSDFVQEMRSKWIHERSVIGVRHRFNV